MNDEQTHDRTPPDDPVFAHPAAEAVADRLPVCRAMTERAALRRHDRRHCPELTRTGAAVMQRMAAAMAGGLGPLRVYPSGREYVVSDDYFSLALYERAGLDEVMRFVLGGPPRVACRDVTPLGPGVAARLLGLQPRVEGGP